MAAKRRKIVKEDLDKGYGATTIPTDSGGTRAASKVGLHTWVGDTYVNLMDFGADLSGASANDTALSNAYTALGGNSGTIWIPRGTFKLTQTFTIPVSRVNIQGMGQQSTIIRFNPGTTASCFKFALATTATIAQNRISGLAIDGTNDTSPKTAIEVDDGEEIEISDIAVSNFTNGGKTCVGIQLKGRQSLKVDRVTISAPNPIVISKNSHSGSPDADHYHLHNCYLLADSNPNITVADGVNLSDLTIDGYQAWVGGTYGFQYNSTTDTTAGLSVRIQNARWEQGTGSSGYGIYYTSAQGVYGLLVENCYIGSAKGFYFRNVNAGHMTGCVYATTSEALNVASSNVHMSFSNNFLNTAGGATISASGFANGMWSANENGSKVALGSTNPTNTFLIPNATYLASLTTAAVEKKLIGIDASNVIVIAGDGTTTYTGGSMFIGTADALFSSKLCIPNTSHYGAQNAAATDSFNLIGSDSSDNVVVNSQKHGLIVYGTEITDQAAPAANNGVMYFRDNGAGKTQLVVRFNTGAIQVIAAEP